MEKDAEEHEKEIKRLNEENVKFKLIISVIIILLLSLIQKCSHNHYHIVKNKTYNIKLHFLKT